MEGTRASRKHSLWKRRRGEVWSAKFAGKREFEPAACISYSYGSIIKLHEYWVMGVWNVELIVVAIAPHGNWYILSSIL